MLTLFLRTIIVYSILIIAMRVMGKRQIGELEVSELVTTLMLSEIAIMPIENQDFPMIYAVIPIITLLAFEVFSSMILIKIPFLRNIVSARPNILIRDGQIIQKELRNNRISVEELMSELRLANCPDISSISYAILEKNGQMSIIQNQNKGDDGCCGIMHPIIIDGNLCKHNLTVSGKTKSWLKKEISALSCSLKEIYLFAVDDSGKTILIRKENK